MRAVIYARYSSENQRAESIDDQIELCRRYAGAQGWMVSATYSDAAESGANKFRPGFNQMLADARRSRFDVVLCESLDRLGRNLADVAGVHDELNFLRIALHTVSQGQMTTVHIGIMGTMAQMTLSDLRDKTRRGQAGRARAGKVPGGLAYGYDVIDSPNGKDEGGERQINPDQADVVRRIFRNYAKGVAPHAIAKTLNAEGVPGPGGRAWIDTTIRGQRDRGTGLLNNTLYVGQLSWNRCSYVKDPRSRKRVARVNPQSEWEIVEVPHLRIIDQDLWDRVKARQDDVRIEIGRDDGGNALNRAHRNVHLLSGLLVCGACGGGYTIIGKDRYGCAAHKGRGTCANSATIRCQAIEARVLSGLKERLVAPELLADFERALLEELASSRSDILERQHKLSRERSQVAAKIEGIMQVLERGVVTDGIGDRLRTLEARQKEIARELEACTAPAPPPRITPAAIELYRKKVAQLEVSLSDPAIRLEAMEVLRALISRIELQPQAGAPDGMSVVLYGVLAEILSLGGNAESRPKAACSVDVLRSASVVAGAGFEPAAFRL